MPRDSVSDMLRFAQSPNSSYRPIRAQIQASPETDDAELVTDICLLVTVIAHGRQQTWLTQIACADAAAEREALDQLKHAQQFWAEEIAAVRHLSDSPRRPLPPGGTHVSQDRCPIDTKIRREFFQFPYQVCSTRAGD